VETPKKDMKTYLFVAWFNSHILSRSKSWSSSTNASGMIPMISPLDGEKYLVNSDGFYSGFHRVFKPGS